MADADIEMLTRASLPDDWSDLDTRVVNTVRVLAADAVQKVGNGHPGTAMSLAPLAYTLFQRVMRHDPKDEDWIGRDRFVLTPGHPEHRQAAAWKAALERPEGPNGLALSRQNLPVLEGTSAEGVAKGGYVLAEAGSGTPEVILLATGSELQIAVEARAALEADGVPTRVVSMPCVEWYVEQDDAYRESVLPAAVRARVSVEAGIAMPWHRFTGDLGENVAIEHFGATADYQTLFREFGFTTDNVVAAARRSLARTS